MLVTSATAVTWRVLALTRRTVHASPSPSLSKRDSLEPSAYFLAASPDVTAGPLANPAYFVTRFECR